MIYAGVNGFIDPGQLGARWRRACWDNAQQACRILDAIRDSRDFDDATAGKLMLPSASMGEDICVI